MPKKKLNLGFVQDNGQYVEREEKQEALRQDAINTWKEYQETGLHVTDQEVITWLDTWAEENEKEAPVCHT